ncbi:hypothetical protein [Sutcliffiella halmapala]|uniref:hypothetical protein n=1 Tax=Sutcliffiella halmapala TaxID=79882 RepID=UPI000994E3CA|nr:hypothetical protein [Sutcliffiella halmapala]
MIRLFSKFVTILVCLLLGACSDANLKSSNFNVEEQHSEEITIIKMHDGVVPVILTEEKAITTIQNVIEGAIKHPGIVNMASPPYKINMGDEIFFLWTDRTNGTTAGIMNAEDTNTIYTLSENLTNQVNELLLENKLLD